MTLYTVKAGTSDGRVVTKEIEAAEAREAAALLEKDGLFPIDVRPKGALPSLASIGRRGGIKQSDFLIFNQGLVTLLRAGVPVIEGLEVLAGSAKDPVFLAALKDAVKGIREGSSISVAMAAQPKVFNTLYRATISAGERTGDLIPSIKSYIEYQKKVEAIRKKVVSSAIYPAVLGGASVVVVAFLIVYVVPTFAKIYTDTGAALPLPTRILIGVSVFVKSYIVFVIAALIALAIFLRWKLRGASFRRYLDRLKLAIPLAGEIYRGYAVAKFSRTLGMVIASGVPLIQGLRMSRDVLNNAVMEEKLDYVIKRATEGGTVSGAMEEVGLLPEITGRMFRVGEATASLPSILGEIAEFHDEDVNHQVGILTDLIEPALMIIMGLVIGTIVVLMYLPIFQLGSRV
ncbi:MAG: type II secretion system F family protein [Deltaproteobacteria bacterium]|nr:type II secretion system F family protein [Deltaproteobacteria bacterium]